MFLYTAILLILCQQSGWNSLSDVTITSRYDDVLGTETEVPIFGDELNELSGGEMTLSGYIIPLEVSAEQAYFVLSRFPYQNCFFCGAAGPETVVEVYLIDEIKNLPPDTKIVVSGRLRLNQTDPLHLFYILEEARIMEP